MKERHRALPAELLQDANHFIPPAVFSRAARLTFPLSTGRAARPTWNLVDLQRPRPAVPALLRGAQLVANYPVSVITDGMGLNITVMSYCGQPRLRHRRRPRPDARRRRLIDWLDDELDELRRAQSTAEADVTADV